VFAGQYAFQIVGIRAGVVILLVAKAGLAHQRFETRGLDSQQLFPLDSVK